LKKVTDKKYFMKLKIEIKHTEKDEKRIKMGCFDRSLAEWDCNFWNNDNEFPNDGSIKSECRLMAYNTAKAWFSIIEKSESKH